MKFLFLVSAAKIVRFFLSCIMDIRVKIWINCVIYCPHQYNIPDVSADCSLHSALPVTYHRYGRSSDVQTGVRWDDCWRIYKCTLRLCSGISLLHGSHPGNLHNNRDWLWWSCWKLNPTAVIGKVTTRDLSHGADFV